MKLFFFRSLILVGLMTLTRCVQAGVAYPDPPGGWTYILNGDQAICGSGAFDSLDGTWNRNNGSSEWDCSAIGGVIASGNFPGGVMTVTNASNAAETNVTYLRIQDPGNTPQYSLLTNNGCGGCNIANPANRKILFVHDMTAEGCPDTVLDDGFTMTFRARIPTPAKTSAPLENLYPNAEQANGPKPYPADGDGIIIQDNANGCLSARQLGGGKLGFSLVTSNDTLGGLTATPKANFRGLQLNGLNGSTANNNIDFNEANTLQWMPLDPTEWNEFWIVITKDDSGLGTHLCLVYTNGSSDAQIFHVTAATSGGEQSGVSHIEMGSSQTAQSGAVDIDFMAYKFAAVFPPGAGGAPPVISSVTPTPPASGNTFWPSANGVSFTASTASSTIQPSGILLVLNGSNVSSGLTIGGTPTSRTVGYSNLVNNIIYTGQIQVTDAGGAKATFPLKFDTFTTASSVVVDAEDYNHDAGQFADNSVPNAYNAFTGTEGVDFHDVTPASVGAYRGDPVDTVLSTDSARDAFVGAGASDYDVRGFEQNEWLNYTRTFPAGKYNVYLRYFSTVSQSVRLDLVTGDRTQPAQTTAGLGNFAATSSGAYSYAPLTDAFGTPLVLSLSGVKTVRLTAPDASLNLYLNYLVFVPSAAANLPPIIGHVSPAANSSNAAPDTLIQISILNRDTAVVPGSINFRLDGTDVTGSSTITPNANGAVITYQLPALLALNSLHTNRVVFTHNAGTPASFTNQWSFRVANLPVLLSSWASPPGSGVNRGFNVKIHQHTGAQSLLFPNTASRGEDQIGGLLIDTGTGLPFSNNAGGPNGDGIFSETNVVNYSGDGTDRGFFPGDSPFPYIEPPAVFEHLALGATAHLELTAGLHRFGVRRNDGFKLSSGSYFTRAAAALALGSFEPADNDYGTARTEFDFMVQADGVYPFRLIFVQNTGPADVEWYSVDRTTGAITLINADTAGSVKAYMSRAERVINGQISGSTITFQYQTSVGFTYFVDFKDALGDPWTLGNSGFTGDGSVHTFSASASASATRYFRIRATQ